MLRNPVSAGDRLVRSAPVRASLLLVPLLGLLFAFASGDGKVAGPLASPQGIQRSLPGVVTPPPRPPAGDDRIPAPAPQQAVVAETRPDAEGASGLLPAPAEQPALAPSSAAGWIFEAPSLGVRASTAAFGLDAAGVMEVPADAVTVAWYRFTAVPGHAGNAVLAAHVDWGGQLGVFNRIDELAEGDQIRLVPASGDPIVYVVQSTELVDPQTADVNAIIGRREGVPTLTLITCGGPFNTTSREYEQRVIVRAALAAAEA